MLLIAYYAGQAARGTNPSAALITDLYGIFDYAYWAGYYGSPIPKDTTCES